MRQVHRDVRALVSAGLLQETRQEARAGRAIRFYRASTEAYFVPRALTPDADYAERLEREFLPVEQLLYTALGREFERAFAGQGQGREWGLRLYWDGQTVQIDQGYADAELRGVLTGWQGPAVTGFTGLTAGPLTREEALEVQWEFVRLAMRLDALFRVNRDAGRGQPFAVRMVLTPISVAELATLHP